MFFNYNPIYSITYRDVGVQTESSESLSLIKTTSDVNSVDSDSYFPDLVDVDVDTVDSDSYFLDTVDSYFLDTVDSDSYLPDLVDSATNNLYDIIDEDVLLKSLEDSSNYIPQSNHFFNFYDIVDQDVYLKYLEDSSNYVSQIDNCGELQYFMITNTDFLSIDPIVVLLRDLFLISIGLN